MQEVDNDYFPSQQEPVAAPENHTLPKLLNNLTSSITNASNDTTAESPTLPSAPVTSSEPASDERALQVPVTSSSREADSATSPTSSQPAVQTVPLNPKDLTAKHSPVRLGAGTPGKDNLHEDTRQQEPMYWNDLLPRRQLELATLSSVARFLHSSVAFIGEGAHHVLSIAANGTATLPEMWNELQWEAVDLDSIVEQYSTELVFVAVCMGLWVLKWLISVRSRKYQKILQDLADSQHSASEKRSREKRSASVVD